MCKRSLAIVVVLLAAFSPTNGQEPKKIVLPSQSAILEIVFSPRVDKLAVRYFGHDPKTHIYEFPSLRPLGDLGVTNCPGSTFFSPCGKYAAVGTNLEKSGAILVWDVSAKQPKRLKLLSQRKADVDIEYGRIEQIRFSADGKKIYAADLLYLHTWNWQDSEISVRESPHPGRFLTDSLMLGLYGKPEMLSARLLRFDGERTTTVHDLGKWLPEGFYFTPDGKHAVVFKHKEKRTTFVLNLAKPGCEIVDRMLDGWMPPPEPEDDDDGSPAHERYEVLASAISADLSVIVHYYETWRGQTYIRGGVGSFPRTSAKAKELGIDLKKHTHVFLPVKEKSVFPPRIISSPDGRWLTFVNINLPPRIWEVETLGKALLAEKTIEKR